jgi:hypothetical protein
LLKKEAAGLEVRMELDGKEVSCRHAAAFIAPTERVTAREVS